MTSVDDVRPAEQAAPAPEAPQPDHRNEDGLKRKASVDTEADAGDSKRHRREDDPEGNAIASRRPSGPSGDLSHDDTRARSRDDDRRKSAAQEEKKRTKRLFGGLLNTLSQTSSNPQHKRRQEIERRQQERLQKQKVEDDEKRAHDLSRLRSIRMAEQIVFEEEVMKQRQAKRLDLARFLRTRAEPHLYYLPWKLTRDQKDTIDDQIRDAKAANEEESADFARRKEAHEKRYGLSAQSRTALSGAEAQEEPPLADAKAEKDKSTEDGAPSQQDPGTAGSGTAKRAVKPADREHADESGDVVVEAGEDMVIY
ncbi:pinin/SDK/memA/ protein conserved region-domain-containing protein [Stachybotrys elegans]|uniref:Pinin/SDK/memA/ protein conserved region-domain-containing protein n=1 Tax=Stachybotrys elegans TaxID=80388 RepID=A0A8K0WWX0_9HYPO|nr:pinin/SDK/memA/ protein conserved region-domain-containing protein [Stachybotrys elegans]